MYCESTVCCVQYLTIPFVISVKSLKESKINGLIYEPASFCVLNLSTQLSVLFYHPHTLMLCLIVTGLYPEKGE